MKRFRFRLQRLLDVRRHEEQQVQLRLGAATGKVVAIDRRLDEITVQQRVELAARSASFDTGSLLAGELYRTRLDQERQRLLGERKQRAEELGAVLAEYAEVARRRKVVDKLRERRERQFEREQRAQEIAAADDLTNSRVAAARGARRSGGPHRSAAEEVS